MLWRILFIQHMEEDGQTSSSLLSPGYVPAPSFSIFGNQSMKTRGKVRSVTQEELAEHSSSEDCWIVIDSKVYDVTKYMGHHPGGINVLRKSAGKDASAGFHRTRHSPRAFKLLEQFYVGDLAVRSSLFLASLLC